MTNRDLIKGLKDQSTWSLLGLGIITYGVYFAFYIKRQTDKINVHLNQESAISNGFITSIFVMSILSAALFIPYLLVDSGHPIKRISDFVDRVWNVMLVVWGFKARNRMNSLCSFNNDNRNWFHGLWTFFSTPLYFNYKINRLNENNAEQVAPADLQTSR
jgi:hypothetical protein